ncbi:hypothetical protein [Luteimonas sp. R10]|uniref:hypothetical protein n=1 Tax=Luteimonas sp. R10 TaxID=3108176 RepID=UPI00308CE494|nr:hypothetical protein U3649_12050 [Luteimonas sp. R10]
MNDRTRFALPPGLPAAPLLHAGAPVRAELDARGARHRAAPSMASVESAGCRQIALSGDARGR